MISDLLKQDAEIEVVGAAKNGQDGLEMARQLKPDVITLDVEMPVMDGVTMLQQLMQQQPTPVLMLSSLTKEGAEITLKCVELGAVDLPERGRRNRFGVEPCEMPFNRADLAFDSAFDVIKRHDGHLVL